jgi:hypothetical protein
MNIFTRMFGSKTDHTVTVQPSGLLEDGGGWYYEESQDYSSSQQTIRIEQDRPGDWYVRESFCEIDGLNDPERAEDVAEFFAGSYRWLRLERRPGQRQGGRAIAVVGTCRGTRGKEETHHLGFLDAERAGDLGTENVKKMWPRIRFIKFPGRGRRPRYQIRFDIMMELAEDTFEESTDLSRNRSNCGS